MSWEKFYQWYQIGMQNGWISDIFCATHDGPPFSDEEVIQWEADEEPCIPCVRVYGQEKIFNHDEIIQPMTIEQFAKLLNEL